MFTISPFHEKDLYSITPAIGLEIVRCPDESCARVHGLNLTLMWLDVGVSFCWMFRHDDTI